MLAFSIDKAREVLNDLNVSGWLIWDFQGLNTIAHDALGLSEAHVTRRFFYWVPIKGDPVLAVHKIEQDNLPDLPGETIAYSSGSELEQALTSVLDGAFAVAMEYYPRGAIPYLSRVDAGTVEWIRSLGVDVVSSSELVTRLLCVWDEKRRSSHQYAVESLVAIKDRTFQWVQDSLAAGEEVDEYDVQQQVVQGFEDFGLLTDHAPIASIGANAGNPHYAPCAETRAPLRENTVLLLDLWARKKESPAVYGDLTYMAWIGPEPVPQRIDDAFRAVLDGRDAALELVRSRWEDGEEARGWELDRAARRVIFERGFGEAFTHRTGHNLGEQSAHGNGPHLDDEETHDDRPLIAGLGFTIEPGVYIAEEDFGIRSEIDVYMHPELGPTVYGEIQTDWHRIDPTRREADTSS